MSTISVPLNKDLEDSLDTLVREGVGSSRADVMRKALTRLAQEEAVNAVLRAQKEVSEGKILRGDLRTIIAKMK